MSDEVARHAKQRESRWNVLLLYLLAGLVTTSHAATSFIYPLNLNRLGHPVSLIGVTVALLGLGSLLSRIPGGAWYRLSRARLLICGALVTTGASAALLGVGDPWAFQACLGALHGFGWGLSGTFLLALLIEDRPRTQNAAPMMAWYTAAISSGYAVGALLGAESIRVFDYVGAFLASSVLALVGAVLSLALRPPPEHERARPRPHIGKASRQNEGIRTIAALPAGVWLATLLAFYINFASDTYHTFFPIYAIAIGIPLGTVGLLKSISSLSATGIRFAAAALLRFTQPGIVNHVSLIAMALAMVGLSLFTSEVLLGALFVVLGFSRGLIRVTSATMVAEERERTDANVGMASGVYNAGLDVGTMLGPPVAGVIAATLDIPSTFLLVGLGLPALYYAIWFTQRARTKRPQPVLAMGGDE